MPEHLPLFPVNRLHLDELSDDVGIMQHAIGWWPDPAHGYCTDDVARALIVDLLHARELGWAAIAPSAGRSMAFLEAAFNPTTGRFRNFRSSAGEWLDTTGSEDAHARAAMALAETSVAAGYPRLRDAAAALFDRTLPASLQLTFLRPVAAATIGCAVVARGGGDAATRALPRLANLLWLAAGTSAGDDAAWPWPEPTLTYENGIVPRALIRAGSLLGDRPMVDRGLRLLDWLVAVQTAPAGHFSPIGNRGWWPRGGDKARYDQQPMEATALLLAAEAALEVTGDPRHRTTIEWAYAWFLGRNDGGLPLALPARGGCQDGLSSSGVNTNQGAESTLMWLQAVERVRASRRSSALIERVGLIPRSPLAEVATA
jgi:hypothetical protein